MSDELCSLFDGLNPGYKLPDFISPISKFAQLSFNNLVNKVKTTFTNSNGSSSGTKTT